MNKTEIIAKIAEKNPHLRHRDVEDIVNLILHKVTSSLVAGDRVEFRGFGAFSVRTRAARTAKNPRDGSKVEVADRKVIHFKCGTDLYNLINK